jgi:DNA-binding SARP family transcriptional activator
MADKSQVLQIFAFGPPEVRLGEHLVTFPTRKTLALLIYLAIEAVLHPRALLATMFWPEATTERSHASLRNSLTCKLPYARRAIRPKPPIYPSLAIRWV